MSDVFVRGLISVSSPSIPPISLSGPLASFSPALVFNFVLVQGR